MQQILRAKLLFFIATAMSRPSARRSQNRTSAKGRGSYTDQLASAEALLGGTNGPTITDLFIGGYDDVGFEKDELNPNKDVINARMSWKAGQPDDGMPAQEVLDSIQYVPDPPCIMPFEEDPTLVEETNENDVPIQNYWKEWAQWISKWPKIKEYKEGIDNFTYMWGNRQYDSRLRSYVVMSNNSLGVRLNPGTETEVMTGQTVLPGMPIAIETIIEKNGVQYLKLPGPGAGYVPGTAGGKAVIAEAKGMGLLTEGTGWMRIITDEHVEIRKYPSYDDEARSGWLLSPREIVVVSLKCKVGGYGYYLLADGRGWVFELKPGASKNNRDIQNLILLPCEDEFVEGEDASILKNLVLPTNEAVEVGMWTYIVNVQPVLAFGSQRFGTFLTPGDVVKVDKRANANGNPPGLGGPGVQNRRWLRLATGNGAAWVPETNEEGGKLLLEQASNEVAYPSWFRDKGHRDKEPWHSGLF